MRDEEILAAVSLESKATGSPERAGTNVASLLRSLDEKGEFRGLTLDRALGKIQRMGLEGEELQKYFGRAEALQAYRDITSNAGQYRTTLQAVDQAQRADEVGKMLEFHKAEPSAVGAKLAVQAKAGEELSRERLGTLRNLAEAGLQREEAARREAGANEFVLWAERKRNAFTMRVGGPEMVLEDLRIEEARRRRRGDESIPPMTDILQEAAKLDPAFAAKFKQDGQAAGAAPDPARDEASRRMLDAAKRFEAAAERLGVDRNRATLNPAGRDK